MNDEEFGAFRGALNVLALYGYVGAVVFGAWWFMKIMYGG